jgi:homoserine dehydrogenase
MYAFTANKGPVVHGFRRLTDLAESKSLKFYFESTVMDGTPIFAVFRELPALNLTSIWGVLNSTSNVILTRMEDGDSFNDAVRYTQEIGIAETDPSGDIEGWDASIKISALITVLMKHPFTPDQVDRKGIENITSEMVAEAKADGKRYKLVAHAWMEGEEIKAKVGPKLVGPDSEFYNINGTTSIVQFESDVLGELSIIEKDPTTHTTAYGLLADFINAVTK